MADLAITAANVLPGTDALVQSGVAGAAITQGQPLYPSTVDGTLWPAIASGSGASLAAVAGIALCAAAAGQPVAFQSGGTINLGATLVKGTVYGLSKNSGKISPLPDLVSTNYVTLLGIALDAANLMLTIVPSAVTL